MKSGWLGVLLTGWTALLFAQPQPVSLITNNDSLVTSLQQQLKLTYQDTARIVLIGKLATRLQQVGNPREALALLQKGLRLAQKTGNPLNLGRIYFQLGTHYDHQSMYVPSIAAFQKAIPLLQKARQIPEATDVMYSLARIHTGHGYNLQAFEQISKNLAYANQTKYFRRVAAAYSLLYVLHNELNDRMSALADLKAMFRAAHQYRYPEDLWVAHADLAQWYEQQHAYEKAQQQWQLALRIGPQLHRTVIMTETYCGLADNLIKQNRLDEAEHFVNKAFRNATNDKRISVDHAQRVLARLRERQNRLDEAYQLTMPVLKYVRRNYPSSAGEILETLYRIQKKQGKYQQALESFQEMKTLSDSLREIRKVRTISMIESKLEFQKQKNDIAILKKNAAILNLKQERTQQRQFTYAGLVIGLTLLVVLISWFGWRARVKNRKLEQQQNEILSQAEHMQELNAIKDKLFLLIGHDLRSPVMNLKSSLNKLTDRPLSTEQFTAQTDGLKRTVDTLYATLDNLLHWSALQRDGLLTRSQTIDLTALVTETLALLEPTILQKHIRIIMEPGSATGWADENQAQIVIRNILHNAIKFTPPAGQIQIHFEQSDRAAIIEVSDTGVGMATTDPQQASQVLSRVGTLGETGTGLGLQVCDEFMKRNQGRLEIESIVGQGTTVRLIFLQKTAFYNS